MGIERQIVMACLADRERLVVHRLGNCLLETDRGFMERTELLVARVLVNTAFAKVFVQLTVMHA